MEKSLNAFYYTYSYVKVACFHFFHITSGIALGLVPHNLQVWLISLCIDDTMIPKVGKRFEGVSMLFDHAAYIGSGYRVWRKKESKLELAVAMIRKIMPELSPLWMSMETWIL